MNFHVINLGCKVNRVEADALISRFLEQGWTRTGSSDADVVIINTCTVTGEAAKKTRKTIRKALRENDRAQVIVTGCAAAVEAEEIKSLDERVIVAADKSFIDSAICSGTLTSSDLEKAPFETHHFVGYDAASELRVGKDFPNRVGIKIQDGCDNACTYCIVHHARGKAWSREMVSILSEVKAYEKAGVKEIVLTGINIGSYTGDFGGLTELLRAILFETTKLRVRISSIEPRDVTDELIDLLASSGGRICRHLHVPLQSGSTKVLREMARPYTAKYFKELIEKLYGQVPQMSLSTDVIVGFPGESEKDFEESLEIARFARFSKIHLFPYSPREGTPAAARIDQVDTSLKEERMGRFATLAASLRESDFKKRRGQKEYVLVESNGWGTSESYHRVAVPPHALPGEALILEL